MVDHGQSHSESGWDRDKHRGFRSRNEETLPNRETSRKCQGIRKLGDTVGIPL